jgi:hypothetical protein
MAITYPLSMPLTPAPRAIRFIAKSVVGMQQSPFSGEQTIYEHQGEWFEIEVDLPPMQRATAEAWIGFLLALNGRRGTFLAYDPVGVAPRGDWFAGSPSEIQSSGAHAAGAKTLTLKNFASGAIGRAGDWISFYIDSSPSLHKVVQDFTANGAGVATVEIWPRIKGSLPANSAIDPYYAYGLWRLTENERQWSVEEAQLFGIAFKAMQAF